MKISYLDTNVISVYNQNVSETMQKATGYSLWLMPSNNAYEQLSALIHELSGAHDTPVFEPHVTLLGGLQEKESGIVARTMKLAEVIEPFVINLTRIEHSNEHFRCLYYRVEKTIDVVYAYRQACDIFRVSEGKNYMPHLSVMYGDIPEKTKEQIIAGINAVITMRFSVQHIDLFSTDGEVEKWYKVKRFHL